MSGQLYGIMLQLCNMEREDYMEREAGPHGMGGPLTTLSSQMRNATSVHVMCKLSLLRKGWLRSTASFPACTDQFLPLSLQSNVRSIL